MPQKKLKKRFGRIKAGLLFSGSDPLKTLGKTLVFGEERLGNGSFIYMVDNTLFRSFWENGKLFLVNALFFVNNNLAEL